MITRKIGKLFRGKSTPFQVYAACILGSMIAFVPGLTQAPGLLLALILCLVVLNANLGVAAIVGIGAKILSLLLTPVSFAAGRVLLHGPTEGLFKTMVNAPVLAYFGFEYYTVTGGLVLASSSASSRASWSAGRSPGSAGRWRRSRRARRSSSRSRAASR
jgi:uncharacterized protein (TIGR03546 family)